MTSEMTCIDKGAYRISCKGEASAEITMYGEIVEQRPVDWWTNEPIEGDFIIQSEFFEDLAKVKAKKLTLRMNSLGGDAGVSILIHNRLRELQANGTEITCIVDGVAMSGGSLIMCACDNVKVNPSSLIMIHKCWSVIYGQYNGDDLRSLAESFDAWDKAQVQIYKRKCGLSETVIDHMMGDTTYMTGKEAIEKGFADELIEDKAIGLAASADRSMIYVNGKAMRMPVGMKAPESIPTKETVSTAEADDINKSVYSDTDELTEGGAKPMATNLTELRTENAELAQSIEAEVRAAVSAEQQISVETSVANERSRLAEIDEIASLYDAETVHEAKYGENPCTAQELAFRAAQKAVKNGTNFMANALEDTEESGANEVESAQAPEAEGEKTESQKMAEAENIFKNLLNKEDK